MDQNDAPAVPHDELAPEPGGDGVVLVYAMTSNRKIALIKVIREATGLGLKDAKDVVEMATPFALLVTDAERARSIQAQLHQAGGEGTTVDVVADDGTFQPVVSRGTVSGTPSGKQAGCTVSTGVFLLVVAGLWWVI